MADIGMDELLKALGVDPGVDTTRRAQPNVHTSPTRDIESPSDIDVDSLLSQLGIDSEKPQPTQRTAQTGGMASAYQSSLVDNAGRPAAPSSRPNIVQANPAVSSAGMASAGPGRGMASAGPGRGMASAGPGRGMASSGPGRGMASSGPGRGMASAGPGRGMVSAGPGRVQPVAAPEEPKIADPNVSQMDDLISQLGISLPSLPEENKPAAAQNDPNVGVGLSAGPGAKAKTTITPAKTTPEGNKVVFTGPPCHCCGSEIIGKFYSAGGFKYHPECFTCSVCGVVIDESTGFGEDTEGKIYCAKDYDELHASRCEACKKPVIDACIKIGERVWHPDHFVCSGCGVRLRGKPYREDEGLPYCPTCKELRMRTKQSAGEICAKCKKPITGEFVIVNGQKIHIEHFRCEICQSEFLGGNFKEHDGKHLCLDCFEKVSRHNCARCNKPIIGRVITALNNVYHPECFSCVECGDLFTKGSYYEHDGKPYCFFHHNQLFGQRCSVCEKVIPDTAITFADKCFHATCFKCHGCSSSLNMKSKVFNIDGKPMCSHCFDRLPKDVQKRVLARKKEEAKREKERLENEKKEAKQLKQELKK